MTPGYETKMKRYLLSDWVNVVGTLIGFYLGILSMAIHDLTFREKGLTFETVVVDTLGGSLMFAYGIFLNHALAFGTYILALILTDIVLYNLVPRSDLYRKLIWGTAIISVLFVSYAIYQEAPLLLILPIVLAITQWRRGKHLLSSRDDSPAQGQRI